MTLGERIQELRRARGLSQEGLGDLLGVSRQAISKWESDTTIPEVDKLIAISRRFEVSVGFLLGVEEQTPAPEQQADPELTERELAAVEAIVTRYLEQLEQTRPKSGKPSRRWKWAAAILAVLLVISWSSISNLNERIGQLSDQTRNVQNQVVGVENTVSDQINSLTGRLEKLLEAQNHLLSEWDCLLTDYIPGEKAVFSLSARPKEYIPGMTAIFYAENGSGDKVSAPAQWDGRSFTAQMDVPLWDSPGFSIELDDGQSRKTQPMETEPIYMLKSHFGLEVPSMGTAIGTCLLNKQGELILDMNVSFELEARTPGDFNRELLRPARLTLVMRCGTRQVLSRDLPLRNWDAESGWGRWSEDVSGQYPVQDVSSLEIELLITDNFGGQTKQTVARDISNLYGIEYK